MTLIPAILRDETEPDQQSDLRLIPRHLAIIMDGNGRWAKARGLSRSEGHTAGVEAVRRTVRAAADRGIRYLTLYSFSSENWRRPKAEVAVLLDLLRGYIRHDLDDLRKNGVRIRVMGSRKKIPADIRALISMAERTTAHNTTLNLQVAFNYGGQDEIVRAAQRIAADAAAGILKPDDISAETFEGYLDTAGIPEPDLLIRTSGEQRLSNFLLWQCAYTEFVFLPVLWPDFDGASIDDAVAQFRGRVRRFGGVASAET